ncbi:MAG TPA: acyltransferase [Candidatus Acidoferrum sp.]
MDAHSESPNLDFLRTAAVSFVVVFHVLLLSQHTSFRFLNLHELGHWGVVIFFVHTSLVLMFSLQRQEERAAGKPIYWTFMIRRIFRIYPLSVVAVFVVALFRLPLAHLQNGIFSGTYLHGPGYLANFLLTTDLSHTISILAPLWSLAYEMRMYFLLPLLYWFARWTRNPLPLLLLWIVAAEVGKYSPALENRGFPDWFVYVPCFLAGILAYRFTSLYRLGLPAWLWPCLLTLVTLAFLHKPSVERSWLCCLALGVALPQFREMTSPQLRKIFQVVARYSYGIYLTHFIFLWVAFDKLGYLAKWIQIVIFVLTVSFVPVALYHYIEEPMILVGHRAAAEWAKLRRSVPTGSTAANPLSQSENL